MLYNGSITYQRYCCQNFFFLDKERYGHGTYSQNRIQLQKSDTHDVSGSSWLEPTFPSAEEEPASSEIDLEDVN